MAENSKIEWTHHTNNLWWGCQKVNPACDFCYAESLSSRYDGKGDTGESVIWGPRSKRKPIKSWLSNLDKFQRKAAKAGENHRVFVGSMMDIFEVSKELTQELEIEARGQILNETGDLRDLFFEQIGYNRWPNLTFLLLTKRPGNIPKMVPASWYQNCPSNVWFGTSIPNQKWADKLIPDLLKAPGTGNKFLSIEPLLGAVDLSYIVGKTHEHEPLTGRYVLKGQNMDLYSDGGKYISWVIVGGESGPNARPMHPDWVRSLRYQCERSGTPFFFKQWGEWLPIDKPWDQDDPRPKKSNERYLNLAGGHGYHGEQVWRMRKVGKKKAGRFLDGQEWNQMPWDNSP